MNDRNKVYGGLILGLAIGAIAGALIIPRTGEENRSMLRERFGAIGNQIRKSRSRLQSGGGEAVPSRNADYLH